MYIFIQKYMFKNQKRGEKKKILVFLPIIESKKNKQTPRHLEMTALSVCPHPAIGAGLLM